MRNYCTAYFTRIDAYDDPYPTSLQQSWWIGLTMEAAHALAVANQGIYSGFPNVDLTDEPEVYLLLNRELIIGALTTVPNSGTLAWLAWKQIAIAEGIDWSISPKKQEVRPWNGVKK